MTNNTFQERDFNDWFESQPLPTVPHSGGYKKEALKWCWQAARAQPAPAAGGVSDEVLIQIIVNAYMQATVSTPKSVKKVAADMLPWLRNSIDILWQQRNAAHERARLRPLLEGVREVIEAIAPFTEYASEGEFTDRINQALAALNAELGE